VGASLYDWALPQVERGVSGGVMRYRIALLLAAGFVSGGVLRRVVVPAVWV